MKKFLLIRLPILLGSFLGVMLALKFEPVRRSTGEKIGWSVYERESGKFVGHAIYKGPHKGFHGPKEDLDSNNK